MRILLTGAAGFVGSHLADRLVADGHIVVGVDNLSTGRLSNLAQLARSASFELVEADASEPLAIGGPLDWVMHFASPASPIQYAKDPIGTLRANAEGTRHLLELARDRGAAFFLASTSEVYGDPLEHPQSESYWGNVNPIGPRSMYNEGKRYAETMTTAFHAMLSAPVRISRIFNTYGARMERDDGRVVSNFIVQALSDRPMTIYGDGSQTRSFQYVDDLVEGVVRMMAADFSSPVNLGNPVEHSMLELARMVSTLVGSQSGIEYQPLPTEDPTRRRPDISLARELLGWEPMVQLEQGLRRTIDAFRSEGEWPTHA